MRSERIIKLAAEAGKLILESGAETYRVEEIMNRICTDLGLLQADSFVTLTGIMISSTDENGKIISLVKRVRGRSTDLEKVAMINRLSYDIARRQMSIDHVEAKLRKIRTLVKYPKWSNILSSCIIASSYTVMMGGAWNDFLVALLIGGLIRTLSYLLSKVQVNDFFVNVVGGGATSSIALLAASLGLASHPDKIIIGSLMLLVPGLAITNAIRDTISGDLLAGMARATEAFLTAIGIAIGSGMVVKIWYEFIDGKIL